VLGLIPRSDQIQLMRGATAVVQPSLFEGWSTVVEDARCLGKRLFVSDIAVHREQDPPAAVFFNPWEPEALANALAKEWAALPHGLDPVAEARARTAYRNGIMQFARNFTQIAEEAPAAAASIKHVERRNFEWGNSSLTEDALTRAKTAM
jgi:hypothetical protein